MSRYNGTDRPIGRGARLAVKHAEAPQESEVVWSEPDEQSGDGPGWDSNKALALAAYGTTNRLKQLIDANNLLKQMHGPRGGWDTKFGDMRCTTCRDSRGRPCPWPCDTFVEFAKVLNAPVPEHIIEQLRDIGRVYIGQRPRTPGLRAAIEAATNDGST